MKCMNKVVINNNPRGGIKNFRGGVKKERKPLKTTMVGSSKLRTTATESL